MARAVGAPGRERLGGREDAPRPTLHELLAADRWRREARDPELKKALSYVQANIGEIRRLHALPADEHPALTPEITERLRDTLDQPVDALTIDSAWELNGDLKAMLPFLSNADHLASLLDQEAVRLKVAPRSDPWTEHFREEDLRHLQESYRLGTLDQKLQGEAAGRLSSLYRYRAEAGRERRAALRRNTRYLTFVTLFLVALLLVNAAVIGLRPTLRDPALLVALGIGFTAGLTIETVKIRDRLATLDDLQYFWPRMRLAVVASAAFCTGFIVAHGAAVDLSERSTSTELLLVGIAALAATCVVVVLSGFWRRWIFWHQEERQAAGNSLFASAVAVAALIEFFAISTVVLAVYGAVDVQGERAPELASAEQYYAWHLADAIPALDVPETLNWERPLTSTDHFGGLLLLTFKLLAILPIAGLLALLIDRYKTAPDGNAGSSG